MNQFSEPKLVSFLLKDLPCRWGVCGGWAVDLFLNRVTRDHQDIEVAIFREDQLILQEYLCGRNWTFEQVKSGNLLRWSIGEHLALPIHEIWCRNSAGPLTQMEVLLNERDKDDFIFRRDSRIRISIDRTFRHTGNGIPILAPEIVLLYKSKRASEVKEKADFSNAVSGLNIEQRRWLFESIAAIDPGHAWLAALRSTFATGDR